MPSREITQELFPFFCVLDLQRDIFLFNYSTITLKNLSYIYILYININRILVEISENLNHFSIGVIIIPSIYYQHYLSIEFYYIVCKRSNSENQENRKWEIGSSKMCLYISHKNPKILILAYLLKNLFCFLE